MDCRAQAGIPPLVAWVRSAAPRFLSLIACTCLAANAALAATLEQRVATWSDDAEEFATGDIYLDSGDLELIYDNDAQTVGMRWIALEIPQGAVITSAYVQFSAAESQSEATSLTLCGHAVDDAPTFTTAHYDISARPRTAASASWTPAAWSSGQAGPDQRTPDLGAVLQEIVNRPGWASGNALALIVTGSGHRTARSYDGSSSLAPLLHVEYDEGPPGTDYPPVARLSVSSSGLAVTADGGASTDADETPISSYRFDFGDGTQPVTTAAPIAAATHTYAGGGTYTVTLTATDTGGKVSAPATRSVTVAPTSPVPDEIHWTFLGQTAVTFDWRAGSDILYYGTTAAYGQQVVASAPDPIPFSSLGPFREARLTGLAENTVYHYAIGGGADRTFRTPPPRGSSDFNVVAEGDIGAAKDWPRVAPIQARIAALAPEFVLVLGDLTYANAEGQAAADAHFNDMMVWSREAAYMPAWGNHEWDTPDEDDLRNYKGRFDLPNSQTAPGAPEEGCCGEDWSWFDYGNVRFISYPEPYSSGQWVDWRTRVTPIMDEAQADPAIRFIVTFGHAPAYSSGYHSGSSSLRGVIAGLAAAHPKYVLNLNGHSHDYERSYPQSGVVHVTAGTGGSNLEGSSGDCKWPGGCPPPEWSAFRAMHHVVVELRFTSAAIVGTVHCGPADASRNDLSCVEGTVLDSFTIVSDEVIGVESGPASGQERPRAWVSPSPLLGAGVLHFVQPQPGPVSISLYDLRGARVRVLMSPRVLPAGLHHVPIDGRGESGGGLPSGVYLYRVSSLRGTVAGKLLLVR